MINEEQKVRLNGAYIFKKIRLAVILYSRQKSFLARTRY